MIRVFHLTAALVVIGVLLFSSVKASADLLYRITIVEGFSNGISSRAVPIAVNESGQVAAASTRDEAILWGNGSFQGVGNPPSPGFNSAPRSMNDAGSIVGQYFVGGQD